MLAPETLLLQIHNSTNTQVRVRDRFVGLPTQRVRYGMLMRVFWQRKATAKRGGGSIARSYLTNISRRDRCRCRQSINTHLPSDTRVALKFGDDKGALLS